MHLGATKGHFHIRYPEPSATAPKHSATGLGLRGFALIPSTSGSLLLFVRFLFENVSPDQYASHFPLSAWLMLQRVRPLAFGGCPVGLADSEQAVEIELHRGTTGLLLLASLHFLPMVAAFRAWAFHPRVTSRIWSSLPLDTTLLLAEKRQALAFGTEPGKHVGYLSYKL